MNEVYVNSKQEEKNVYDLLLSRYLIKNMFNLNLFLVNIRKFIRYNILTSNRYFNYYNKLYYTKTLGNFMLNRLVQQVKIRKFSVECVLFCITLMYNGIY